MSTDTLLNWASNPSTRKMMSTVGLPTPQPLKRAEGPWAESPLDGQTVSVSGPDSMKQVIAEMGASIVDVAAEDEKLHALVFDGRHLQTVEELRKVYDFFHSRVRTVGRCGRVVVVGKSPADCSDPVASAVQQGLVGFTKSVSKEMGRKGSTANLLTLAEGSDDGIAGPLRFLLGLRSAFVTGQTLHVDSGSEAGIWSQPLSGKTALVTGCARGIGQATARRLARRRVHLAPLRQSRRGVGALGATNSATLSSSGSPSRTFSARRRSSSPVNSGTCRSSGAPECLS